MITEPWYKPLAERYGEEFCRIAGYFEETKPFVGNYRDVFDLPERKTVIQFSGAFHPFHDGHLSIVLAAVKCVKKRTTRDIHVIIHADHAEYRHSKGSYDEEAFLKSFDILNGHGIEWTLVREDLMPEGCSRNFTRLYTELWANYNDVYFLSGGDRANYALTFLEHGQCIIAGRDDHFMYNRYKDVRFANTKSKMPNRVIFLEGNNKISSTQIRNNV